MTETKKFKCLVNCPRHCEFEWDGVDMKPFKCVRYSDNIHVMFAREDFEIPKYAIKMYNDVFSEFVKADHELFYPEDPITKDHCAFYSGKTMAYSDVLHRFLYLFNDMGVHNNPKRIKEEKQ